MASDRERKKPTPRKATPRQERRGSRQSAVPVPVRGLRHERFAKPAKAARPAKAAKSAKPHKGRQNRFSLLKFWRGSTKPGNEIPQLSTATGSIVPMTSTKNTLAMRLHIPTKRKANGVIQKGLPSDADMRRMQRQARQANRSYMRDVLPSPQSVLRAIFVSVFLLLFCVVLFFILSQTSLFSIENVDPVESEHVSADSIMKIVTIPDNATLLNIDVSDIEDSIKRNPWVKEVNVQRIFPSTLRISIVERDADALVVMSSGEVVWILGEGGIWIEPVSISANEDQDFIDIALSKANEMDSLLITDSPASVSPVSGETVTDENLLAVKEFQEGFSSSFRQQIASYSAATTTSISCTLKSGVTISLGSATDIYSKEEIVKALLEEYPNMITYINVRVPTSPSYRSVNTSDVMQGTGTYGTADEEDQTEVDLQDADETEEDSTQSTEEDS